MANNHSYFRNSQAYTIQTDLLAVIKKAFDELATLDMVDMLVRKFPTNRLPASPPVINRHLLVALAIANNNGTHRFPMSDRMMLDVFITKLCRHIQYGEKKRYHRPFFVRLL